MNDPAKPNHNPLDALKLVLGLDHGKHKKSKTKRQQKKKKSLRATLETPMLGYTLRQCNKKLFILTTPNGAESINLKFNPPYRAVIEKESRFGSKYARK